MVPPSSTVLERSMVSTVAGHRLPYLLSVPEGERPGAGWPLLLFLHGAGERGDDLSGLRVHGPPKLLSEVPELRHFALVAPQCPDGTWWRVAALRALIDEVRTHHEVDPARIYVTGMSMGGYATWHLLAHYPELFAAAVAICGGGDPRRLWPEVDVPFAMEDLLRAKHVPIRAFHGENDDIVPVEESRLLVRALTQVGANVQLTVYPGVGHDSWTRTYTSRDLYRWILDQRRPDHRTLATRGLQ